MSVPTNDLITPVQPITSVNFDVAIAVDTPSAVFLPPPGPTPTTQSSVSAAADDDMAVVVEADDANAAVAIAEDVAMDSDVSEASELTNRSVDDMSSSNDLNDIPPMTDEEQQRAMIVAVLEQIAKAEVPMELLQEAHRLGVTGAYVEEILQTWSKQLLEAKQLDRSANAAVEKAQEAATQARKFASSAIEMAELAEEALAHSLNAAFRTSQCLQVLMKFFDPPQTPLIPKSAVLNPGGAPPPPAAQVPVTQPSQIPVVPAVPAAQAQPTTPPPMAPGQHGSSLNPIVIPPTPSKPKMTAKPTKPKSPAHAPFTQIGSVKVKPSQPPKTMKRPRNMVSGSVAGPSNGKTLKRAIVLSDSSDFIVLSDSD